EAGPNAASMAACTAAVSLVTPLPFAPKLLTLMTACPVRSALTPSDGSAKRGCAATTALSESTAAPVVKAVVVAFTEAPSVTTARPQPPCCECAASGHPTAPPSSVMKSRRLMSSTDSPPEPGVSAYTLTVQSTAAGNITTLLVDDFKLSNATSPGNTSLSSDQCMCHRARSVFPRCCAARGSAAVYWPNNAILAVNALLT